MASQYRTSLLGCLDDLNICLTGCCCLPCLNGDNLSKVRNEHCTVCHVMFPVAPFWIRQFIRENRRLPKDCGNDCIMSYFCAPCFICQDAREIKGY